jgi:hypothetical protein
MLMLVVLTGVQSGSITGKPASLPGWGEWQLLSGYLIGPGDNLSGAALAGADLAGADLVGTDFDNADLAGADLSASLISCWMTGVNLQGTNLSGAALGGGVSSGGITGTPSALPANWLLKDGYLIGPNAWLAGADLAGASLAGADMSVSNLTGANLTGTATSASCSWTSSARQFTCTITTPRGIRTGKKYPYTITAAEKPGTTFQTAPRIGKAANPETIYFS